MSFNFPSRTKGVFRFFYIQKLRLWGNGRPSASEQPLSNRRLWGKKNRCVLIRPLGSPGYKQVNRSVFSGYRA